MDFQPLFQRQKHNKFVEATNELTLIEFAEVKKVIFGSNFHQKKLVLPEA